MDLSSRVQDAHSRRVCAARDARPLRVVDGIYRISDFVYALRQCGGVLSTGVTATQVKGTVRGCVFAGGLGRKFLWPLMVARTAAETAVIVGF